MLNKLSGILLISGLLLSGFYNQISGKAKDVDSLLTLIKNDKQDTTKINHLNQLSLTYRHIYWYDSAINTSTTALHLAERLNYKRGIAQAHLTIGTSYIRLNNYSKALHNISIAAKLYKELGDKNNVLHSYMEIGLLEAEYNNYTSAMKHFSVALEIAKELNNKDALSRIYNNFAQIYQARDNYPQALEYLLLSLKLKEEIGNKSDIAMAYNNLGAIYSVLNKYDEAMDSYTKAITLRKELDDKRGLAYCNNNLGVVYQNQNKLTEALNSFKEALKIGQELPWKPLIAEASINIAGIYIQQQKYNEAVTFLITAKQTSEIIGDKSGVANALVYLGYVDIKLNNLKAAKEYLNQGLQLSKEAESKDLLQKSYEHLTTIDSIQGNWKAAYNHHKLAILHRDSINNNDIQNKITTITLTHEFNEKAEKIKLENEKQQLLAEAENRRQTIISWSVGGGLLLVLIATAFILRSLRTTRKQKGIIEEQKQVVEEKQKEIVDSIKYAKRIQTVLLTSDQYINEHFEAEHFILFKPKDIVSGDFYWALSTPPLPAWDKGSNSVKIPQGEKKKNLFYLITADCTGHGVPGAMMSMLNISFLNEIVIERGIQLPHEILNTQRKEIIRVLNPEGSQEEAKDGMDCILCVFDFNKMLLHFAAANNPLWLVRPSKTPMGVRGGGAAVLTEHKADKMPVGKYEEKTASFTLQTIELQKGDIIYTSTDGFADQFGTNDKKLTKKKFKEELLKIHHLPMPKQQQHLNKFFENWKGNSEQIDDVCVIGVKI